MAIKKQYALLDHVAEVFLNAVTFNNDAEAIRWFGTVVNGDPQESMVASSPESFSLYRMMDYDDQFGVYKARKGEDDVKGITPKQIIIGLNVKIEKTAYTLDDLKRELLGNNNQVPRLLKEQAS